MLTTHPARILRRPAPELRVGALADLVVWDSERSVEIVSTLATCRLSVKAGRVAVEHARSLNEAWRTT